MPSCTYVLARAASRRLPRPFGPRQRRPSGVERRKCAENGVSHTAKVSTGLNLATLSNRSVWHSTAVQVTKFAMKPVTRKACPKTGRCNFGRMFRPRTETVPRANLNLMPVVRCQRAPVCMSVRSSKLASDHAQTPLFSVGADPPHAGGPLAVAW